MWGALGRDVRGKFLSIAPYLKWGEVLNETLDPILCDVDLLLDRDFVGHRLFFLWDLLELSQLS